MFLSSKVLHKDFCTTLEGIRVSMLPIIVLFLPFLSPFDVGFGFFQHVAAIFHQFVHVVS